MLAEADFKQHEFYWMIEYAAKMGLRGARATAKVLRDDPEIDFHAIVAEMAGLDDRQTAKSVNFAKIYGAGVKKLAAMIGKPLAETQEILAKYDKKLPFVSELDVFVKERANRLGYTAMIDGSRRHWNPVDARILQGQGGRREEGRGTVRDRGGPAPPRRSSASVVSPAALPVPHLYGLNALIQGTAARHTKIWMREVWRAGIVPLLQMHDSLICSVTSREQGELVARLGRECVELEEVPMRTDLKYGRNWDDAKHSWEELTDDPAPVAAGDAAADEGAAERLRRMQRLSASAAVGRCRPMPIDAGRRRDDDGRMSVMTCR